jgi:Mrp family chromosome partitioning ATPase
MTDAAPFEPSLVGAIWRDRRLVASVLIASLTLAFAYALTRPLQYTATASVLVEDPNDQGGGDPPERYVADQAAVLRSSNVAREAVRIDLQRTPRVGLPMAYYLKHAAVSLSARDSNLIRVSFSTSTATAAKRGVDNIVQAYMSVLRTNAQTKFEGALAQIDADLARIEGELTGLTQQLKAVPAPAGALLDGLDVQQRQLLERQNTLRVERGSITRQVDQATRTVALYDPPETATKAGLLSSARALVLALVLGGIVSGLAAYARATRKPTFFRANEPELVLGAPLLADVPAFDPRSAPHALPVVERPASPAAHAYRYAAASIDIQRVSAGIRRLTVTSAGDDDGRSTATANIALALAASGVHTLVMDGDLEAQGLSRRLRGDLVEQPGWLDLVAGRSGLTDAVVQVPAANVEGLPLDLLTAGKTRTSAAEFFGADNSRRLLEVLLAELADRYDVVIVDAPPLLQVTHAATLAGGADSVLVVVSHGAVLADQEEIGRRLRLIGRPPMGYLYVRPASSRLVRRRARPSPAIPFPTADAPVGVAALAATPPAVRPSAVPAGASWTCSCSRDNPPAFANCPRCGRPQPDMLARHRTAGG